MERRFQVKQAKHYFHAIPYCMIVLTHGIQYVYCPDNMITVKMNKYNIRLLVKDKLAVYL